MTKPPLPFFPKQTFLPLTTPSRQKWLTPSPSPPPPLPLDNDIAYSPFPSRRSHSMTAYYNGESGPFLSQTPVKQILPLSFPPPIGLWTGSSLTAAPLFFSNSTGGTLSATTPLLFFPRGKDLPPSSPFPPPDRTKGDQTLLPLFLSTPSVLSQEMKRKSPFPLPLPFSGRNNFGSSVSLLWQMPPWKWERKE